MKSPMFSVECLPYHSAHRVLLCLWSITCCFIAGKQAMLTKARQRPGVGKHAGLTYKPLLKHLSFPQLFHDNVILCFFRSLNGLQHVQWRYMRTMNPPADQTPWLKSCRGCTLCKQLHMTFLLDMLEPFLSVMGKHDLMRKFGLLIIFETKLHFSRLQCL